jgi:hypothetical protein
MVFGPPLIVAALGVVGAAVAVKYLVNRWQRANAERLRPKDAPIPDTGAAVPKLRRDPETGIYRP